jgi:hypothetical protein
MMMMKETEAAAEWRAVSLISHVSGPESLVQASSSPSGPEAVTVDFCTGYNLEQKSTTADLLPMSEKAEKSPSDLCSVISHVLHSSNSRGGGEKQDMEVDEDWSFSTQFPPVQVHNYREDFSALRGGQVTVLQQVSESFPMVHDKNMQDESPKLVKEDPGLHLTLVVSCYWLLFCFHWNLCVCVCVCVCPSFYNLWSFGYVPSS